MLKNTKKPAEILSVEDNPADVAMLQTLFSGSQVPLRLSFVEDGVEALDLLLARGKFQGENYRPDLMLLDLNLPKRDGREVLKELKSNLVLKSIPVIILSTSNNPRDVQEAYSLGASAFVSKPMDLEWFQSVVKAIEMFWLQVADLPGRRSEGPPVRVASGY
jgi:two-component system, chemotaxis family, response regulator Rcp1